MDIYDKAMTISNKMEFVEFLVMFKQDFSENPQEWQNNTLASFLEGLYGYCNDIQTVDEVNWKGIADILLGAIVYE